MQNISDRIFILSPSSCPKGGTLGRLGCPGGGGGGGGGQFFFFKHGDVAYQIDRDDKQNKMQVKIFILRSNW